MTKLDDLRSKLLAIHLLSRQMLGKVDELKYHTEFFDTETATTQNIIEALYQPLVQDYERLKYVCKDTILPEKEHLND